MSDFPATRWGSIIAVIKKGSLEDAGPKTKADADRALETLCKDYWFPIFAYARSRGYDPHDAADLAQTFFAELSVKRLVDRADRDKTKFRTFLLAQFDYVLSNERRKDMAQKRGGGAEHLSIDAEEADESFHNLAGEQTDPCLIYDRAWAHQILNQVLRLLQEEYERNNKDVPFDALLGYLPGGAAFPQLAHEELAAKYPPLKPKTLTQRISRLRANFRELLESVVAETVGNDPAEVKVEIAYLIGILGSS